MAEINSKESTEMKKKELALVNMDELSDPELLLKHPLQCTWTLWYFELDRTKKWEDCNHEIASVDTAEDFWSLYNHIKSIPDLRQGSDYSMFKEGIRPMWEDRANINGGRWLITLDRKQRSTELDRYWLETLLCMIGEGFDEFSDDVCGAVVNVRPRQDKLALWTANATNSTSIMEIGRKLKERLGISKMMLGYQIHNDTKDRTGSMAKNTYTL
ncbi:eukaryotic translation initiation factor 4E-like [Belonocnema kinseyi]|uniref:eukaryotic translation initiation factor 4E-like n=1 Tax=Belonocnema kinseyi TaxID=2817044 RepID=UPI00143CFAF8|nr:eukaryotic translation initiation factor 4E-like [Belonocnema kinseyi]